VNIEEFHVEYPGLPDHEWTSAHDSCPWTPDCDRGKAYMMGYLIRAWQHHQYKKAD